MYNERLDIDINDARFSTFDSKYLVSEDRRVSPRHTRRNCTVKNWSKL